MPNTTDQSRMLDRQSGAEVISLDKFRARADDDDAASEPFLAPKHAVVGAILAAFVVLALLSIRG